MVPPPISMSVSCRGDIMYALEESSFCIRLICKQNRPWIVNLSAGPGTPGGARERALPRPPSRIHHFHDTCRPVHVAHRCCRVMLPLSPSPHVPKPQSAQPLEYSCTWSCKESTFWCVLINFSHLAVFPLPAQLSASTRGPSASPRVAASAAATRRSTTGEAADPCMQYSDAVLHSAGGK